MAFEAAPETQSRAGPYAWYVAGILTLANVCALVDRQILTLLVDPIQRDLGITLTQMSYLIGVPFAVFFTLMGIPIARLADRGNRRAIIATGIALWSVMTAACGLAGTYGRLLFARIGVGVGEASLLAPGTSLLADYFDRRQLPTATSVFQTGVFFGSGVAYLIGGWVVGLVGDRPPMDWPIVGAIRPWQTVFLFVGLPGLVVALLMLTVREPSRREGAGTAAMPVSAVLAYLKANVRVFAPLLTGLTLSAAVNWGMAAFLATFLMRSHGWTPTRAGAVQGLLTIAIGPIGVITGAFVEARLRKRGHADAPVRIAILGAAGMLVSATAYPFVASDSAVIAVLAVVNLFAAMPWGVAVAGAAELVPSAMRAQGISLYFIGVSLVSQLLGPWAVAVVTDSVFGRESALGLALAIVNAAGMSGAIALLTLSLPAYRRAITAIR